MPHACYFVLVSLVVGYVLRGMLDDVNKALKKDSPI